MAMRVSEGFIDHLCSLEGLRTTTYTDSGGVRTIGCGHTGSAVNRGSITRTDAYDLVRKDVERFEACIHRNVTAPLTQGAFDALVSLAYNMGCNGIMGTGVVQLVNQKRYQEAADKIRTVGLRDRKGNVLRGLITRRNIEADMFLRDGSPDEAVNLTKRPLISVVSPRRMPSWSWWVLGTLAIVGGGVAIYRRYKK